ncbi:hypothetical protein ACTMLZ_07255, partial [Escherichia coli]
MSHAVDGTYIKAQQDKMVNSSGNDSNL